MAVRTASTISFAEPLHVVTSGWEQESLAAFHLALEGEPVYVSRFEVPFRWAIYNWLYYEAYTGVFAVVRDILGLDPAWLPTVARTITLAGVATGVPLVYLSMRTVVGDSPVPDRVSTWAVALLLAAGPLVGFWGITARPDLWAMVLEVAAVYAFWRLRHQRPVVAIVALAILAYGAWALKQSNVSAAAAVGLFLLIRGHRAEATALAVLLGGAFAATLALGGADYVASILLLEYDPAHDFVRWVAVMSNAAAKSLPVVFGAFAVLWVLGRGRFARRLRDDDPLLFALCGLGVSTALALATSAHTGAAESYYFATSFFAGLAALAGGRSPSSEPGDPGPVGTAMTAGWVLHTVLVAAVLAGLLGTTSVRATHDLYAAARPCLDGLSRPLFVADLYLSLPWMTPGNAPFVLAFGYHRDRARGRPFAFGGVGGLIESGHFATLALPPGTGERFDGGRLTRYRPSGEACGGLVVFHRNDS